MKTELFQSPDYPLNHTAPPNYPWWHLPVKLLEKDEEVGLVTLIGRQDDRVVVMPIQGEGDSAFILTDEEFSVARPARLHAKAVIAADESQLTALKEVLELLGQDETIESLKWSLSNTDAASAMAAMRLLSSQLDMAAFYE